MRAKHGGISTKLPTRERERVSVTVRPETQFDVIFGQRLAVHVCLRDGVLGNKTLAQSPFACLLFVKDSSMAWAFSRSEPLGDCSPQLAH
eukprot:3130287-Amphidinium_carterae.1